MVVGALTVDTDVVVIGAGPGGYVAAIRAAQLGFDVTLIDQDKRLGGICLNHGCIPTKALIHASNFFSTLKELDAMGIHVKDYAIDHAGMKAWKDSILQRLGDGISSLCQKHGIEVINGIAGFTSSTMMHIGGQSDVTAVNFKHAIIATGSLPVEIPGFPFSHPLVMSSRDALALTEVPQKLVIIGGGYIGTEMGTVYGKLGSEVHIVEMAERLIPTLDPEIVQVVARRLAKFNVTTHLKSAAKGLEEKGGRAVVTILQDGKEQKIDADKVLVVVGRRPNTASLGLEKTKVTLDKGFIRVDNQMRTTDPHIFAIGDCVGQPMLAHKASREGKIAAEVIAGRPSAFDNKVIPFVVFNDPEIASVGMTEAEAKQKGIAIKTGRFPFSALGRAMTLNQTDGFVKFVTDEKGLVLGVHGVGPGMSDIISEAALAIELGATAEDIALTIHPHPTLSESLMEAAEAVLGESIHIYQPKKDAGQADSAGRK